MPTIRMIAAIAALVAATAPSAAQDWPTRPVTMVIPFGAGSGGDAFGRILSARLSEVFGQQVIVENLPGAGGMLGASRVAKAAPDGSQFLLGSTPTQVLSQSLYKNPLYNAATDFAPVVLIADVPLILLARHGLPAGNLPEFIAYAKANQAKMQYGSAGVGSGSHLACALLNTAIVVNVTHVPYRDSAQAMQDLIAGRIDYFCPLVAAALPQVEAKTITALATLARNRSAILPNVPTADEQGLTDFVADDWQAFFLPKRTPAAIIRKLHDATVATMNTPSVQERLKSVGADLVAPDRTSPEYVQKLVERGIEKWAPVVKANGLSAD
jgi:tripartite-type tricarboxylate transporter receptor subunit TctC